MKLFNLFLRRAGIQRVPVRVVSPLSRLTVVCPRDALAGIRKQIYIDFRAAGLQVTTLHVDHAQDRRMSTACITVNCPPELRSVLLGQARQLKGYPGVHQVQWGDRRHIALN